MAPVPDFTHDMTQVTPRRPFEDAIRAADTFALAGVAGLWIAGALAMATGRYAAVSSQNELVRAQTRKQGLELLFYPGTAQTELAGLFRSRGFSDELADSLAQQVSADPEQALAVQVREWFGIDHGQLPAPVPVAAASLVTFAAGGH
jgi:vacuolar iron transporter family protein